ncbi:hypothetical protein D3C81_1025910 [compost metagenome]
MAVAGIEARRREPELPLCILVVIEAEIPAPLKVPPLDQHCAGAELPQSCRSCPYQRGAGRRNAGQCLQLGAVGGNEGEAGQQVLAHRRQHVGLRHGGACAGNGHGVVDHEGGAYRIEPPGQHLHMEPGRQQTDLDGGRGQIDAEGVDLGAEGLHQHRIHHLHRHRVLGRDGGDDGAAVHAEGVQGVQIGLDAGTAPRVGTCYGPDDGLGAHASSRTSLRAAA